MSNQDWFEQQNSTPNGYQYNGYQGCNNNCAGGTPYDNQSPKKPKKEKKLRTITAGTLVVCLLLTALIGGGVGALAVTLATSANTPAQQEAMLPEAGNSSATQESTEGGSGSVSSGTPSNNIQTSAKTLSQELSIRDIAAKCMPSIVGIDVEIHQNASYYYGEGSTSTGSGSGVILTEDGYIVTNNHVIEGATAIKVYLQDGTSYEAELIGTDDRLDLAVIKVDAKNLVPATLGNSDDLAVGDPVVAIGNPLGELMSTVTGGWISGLNRTIVVDNHEMTLMQTDAAVNPGNSGGGLFNSKGELVGIVNAKSMGYDVEGLGFAIPIDSVLSAITDLMDQGYVSGRPYLGVSMQEVYVNVNGTSQNEQFGFPFNLQRQNYAVRVQIVEVVKGGAADKAGLQIGDMILAVDDTEVKSVNHLINLIGEYNAGDTVTLSIQRGTQSLTLTATFDEKSA